MINLTDSVFLSTTPPPAPEVFYGRTDFVSRAVSVIRATESPHLAILGSGGIGKTTVALAILHDDDIQQTFQNKRYFVPCDAVTSPHLLIQHILQVLGVNKKGSYGDPLTVLHEFLVSACPLLLVLDNFETPWVESDDQTGVESVLQRIAAIQHVALIITMRGTETPSGVHWAESEALPPLSPLSLDAARSAFLKVARQRPSKELDELLKEL